MKKIYIFALLLFCSFGSIAPNIRQPRYYIESETERVWRIFKNKSHLKAYLDTHKFSNNYKNLRLCKKNF